MSIKATIAIALTTPKLSEKILWKNISTHFSRTKISLLIVWVLAKTFPQNFNEMLKKKSDYFSKTKVMTIRPFIYFDKRYHSEPATFDFRASHFVNNIHQSKYIPVILFSSDMKKIGAHVSQ